MSFVRQLLRRALLTVGGWTNEGRTLGVTEGLEDGEVEGPADGPTEGGDKNHFIALLSGTYPSFPLAHWDRLLLHDVMIRNMLRSSDTILSLST